MAKILYIREWMNEKGCSAHELAKRLCVSTSCVYAKMNGNVSLYSLNRIAQALRIEPQDLFCKPQLQIVSDFQPIPQKLNIEPPELLWIWVKCELSEIFSHCAVPMLQIGETMHNSSTYLALNRDGQSGVQCIKTREDFLRFLSVSRSYLGRSDFAQILNVSTEDSLLYAKGEKELTFGQFLRLCKARDFSVSIFRDNQ